MWKAFSEIKTHHRKKRLTTYVSLFFIVLFVSLFPCKSWAKEDPGSGFQGSTPDFLQQMKKMYPLQADQIEKADWAVTIIIVIASITAVIAFCALIWAIIYRILQVQRGKRELADQKFWITILLSFVLLFAFMSGLIMYIMEQFYEGVIPL